MAVCLASAEDCPAASSRITTNNDGRSRQPTIGADATGERHQSGRNKVVAIDGEGLSNCSNSTPSAASDNGNSEASDWDGNKEGVSPPKCKQESPNSRKSSRKHRPKDPPMLEKESVAGFASSSASQAIALQTDGLRELLVQLIDERLRAVHAGLAEAAVSDQAKKEDSIGPLNPGPTTSTRAEGGEKSLRRREDPTTSRMVSPTGTPNRL